jgi:hypothetical protein
MKIAAIVSGVLVFALLLSYLSHDQTIAGLNGWIGEYFDDIDGESITEAQFEEGLRRLEAENNLERELLGTMTCSDGRKSRVFRLLSTDSFRFVGNPFGTRCAFIVIYPKCGQSQIAIQEWASGL